MAARRLSASRPVTGRFLPGADAIEVLVAADEDPALGEGGCGLAFFAERVAGQDFEAGAVGDDGGFARVVEEVDPAGRPERRGAVVAAHALLVDDLAGGAVDAEGDARVGDGVEVGFDVEQGREGGGALALLPCDVGGGDIPLAAGAHGAQGGGFKAAGGEDQALASGGAGGDAFAAAVNGPEPAAAGGVERLNAIAGAAHNLGLGPLAHDHGGDVGDAGFAALAGPDPAAGAGVQGGEEGFVPGDLPAEAFFVGDLGVVAGLGDAGARVVGHDEKPVVKQGRGAQAVAAVELNFPVGPGQGAVEVQGGHAAVVEDGVNALAVGARGGGGVGVFAFLAQGHLLEDLAVPHNAAGVAVQAQDVAAGPAVQGRCDKDRVVPHHRGSPALARDGRFPQNIGGLVPVKGQGGLGGEALAGGTAEAGPVFSNAGAGQGGGRQHKKSETTVVHGTVLAGPGREGQRESGVLFVVPERIKLGLRHCHRV